MNLFQRRDERFVVVITIVIGKRFAFAEFFEKIIHSSNRDIGMVRLDGFAMAIQSIAQFTNGLFLCVGGIGERERVETDRIVIARAIF